MYVCCKSFPLPIISSHQHLSTNSKKIKMCRKYSRDRDDSHRHSLMSIDSQAQAHLPPLPVRTMTQPTAPADREKARKFIDTNNLDEQDLKNLKKYDPFLYYSIPSVVRDAKAKVVSNEEFQVQPALQLQDQDGSHSSIDSNSATATTTSTMVERKSRISYECHPDLLLESLFEDDDSDYSVVEHEDEDCDVVDPIMQLMYRYSTAR